MAKQIKVFGTIGSTYPLDRMTKALDELAKNKKYDVFVQTGKGGYSPIKAKFAQMLEYGQFVKRLNWADVIVSHAGAGSIIDLIGLGKPIILFPRLKKFGEAVDDHQLEICKAFKEKYNLEYTINQNELIELIKKAKKSIKSKENKVLVNKIKEIINSP